MSPDVPPPVLPRTYVLSYLTAINTPTRVRRVAYVALWVIGVLTTLGGLVAAAFLANELYRTSTWLPAGWSWPDFLVRVWLRFKYGLVSDPLPLLVPALPALIGPIFIVAARPVFVGNRFPALLTRVLLLVPVAQLACYSAAFYGWALVMSLPVYGTPELDYFPRLLTLPIPVLAILLLLDLRAFLLWISRNPGAEKPPTPFLPGKSG
jgi:hypothetical protein